VSAGDEKSKKISDFFSLRLESWFPMK